MQGSGEATYYPSTLLGNAALELGAGEEFLIYSGPELMETETWWQFWTIVSCEVGHKQLNRQLPTVTFTVKFLI